MSDAAAAEELRARIKKLSFQAVQRKLELHDLSEELPMGWEQILEVAGRTQKVYAELAEAKKQLAELGETA
jgi:hypothetical protein